MAMDMDSASSIPTELCSALQSFGEGIIIWQAGSQTLQCKSDKNGGDGQVGWCHRHNSTISTTAVTAWTNSATSFISHISLIPAHQPAQLLACSLARLRTSAPGPAPAQCSLTGHHPLSAVCGLARSAA